MPFPEGDKALGWRRYLRQYKPPASGRGRPLRAPQRSWCGYRRPYACPRLSRPFPQTAGGNMAAPGPGGGALRRSRPTSPFRSGGARYPPPPRPARRVVRATGPALPARRNSHVSSPAEGRPGRGGATPPGAPVSSTCGAPAPPIPEQVGESCAFDWSGQR